MTRRNCSGEQAVIALAQKGDADAFEQLYTAHKRRVYSVCAKMMRGNNGLAEELTQDAFLQVHRKIQTFRGESAFSTWLHRIAFNTVMMRLRRAVVQEVSFEELQPQQEDGAPKKEFGNDDSRLESTADRIKLQGAIDGLPDGYQMVFVLHEVYGYEHNEIAEILSCSIGNSKSQLHKARKSVLKRLQTGNSTVSLIQ